jgi:DNA repair protein SbcC/Rad50
MKPIKLRFTGLNSYRTEQVVNFEVLGAEGLFGIFGPTGSGKSSILDAITLALYGGVDRASNNTRGIIHQLERTLEVSFEFELGGIRYLVERHYERNPKDPEAVVAKQARLRRLNPEGETVLASKPQEVTIKLEETLGIGRDEFSRAVILPQGKFDQFLRLTGGDRAAMMEHLFNLEQFGEGLIIKVKNQTGVLSEQLQRIEGEEQGLGDCSQEAVNQADSDLQTKTDEYRGAQKDFETADKSYKEAEVVRELFLKRRLIVEKFNQLTQEQETIAEKQSRLNAAERAEPLRGLLTRQKELQQKVAMESTICQNKSGAHSDALTQHRNCQKALEIAEKEYNEQLPQLQERKARYQGAQEKQKKSEALQKNIDEKQQELTKLECQLANSAKKIVAGKSLVEDTRLALESLQQERVQFVVNLDEKALIESALPALFHLEESEKRCQETEENYTQRKLQSDTKWGAIIEQVHEMLPNQPVLAGDDIEEYSKSLLEKAEKSLDDARKAQQQTMIINLAAELVKELHEGDPCPVCGSREHPLPVESNRETEKNEVIIKAAEDRVRATRIWDGELLKLWHDWNTNQVLIAEAQQLLEKNQKDLQAASAEFEKIRGKFERDQLRIRKQEVLDFEKQLHFIDQKQESMRKTQAELNGELQKLYDLDHADKITAVSLQEALKSLTSQLNDVARELNQITDGKDLDDLIRDMVQTYNRLQATVELTKQKEAETRAIEENFAREITVLEATITANRSELEGLEDHLSIGLEKAAFKTVAEVEAVLLEAAERQLISQQLEQHRQEVAVARNEMDNLEREINNRPFEEKMFAELNSRRDSLFQEAERLKAETTLAQNKVNELREKQERWNELKRQKTAAEKRKQLAEDLANLLRGRKFVSFLAGEHLRDMTLEASYQLGRLTGQRYALELTAGKDCDFMIRDDYNGGNRRTISSLSGGEIFMTSLALALALSSKIQLRGKYPLGFFFLDEGFGTLDEEKLDKVMNALEKLHDKNRMVGVISHVRELKERLPRYLEVTAAGEDGSGSEIRG